jgi:putative transposase
MARPLRIEYEGAFYHVTSRGNERKRIFSAKSDYSKFKEYLGGAQEKYGCVFHGYVLMTNHYHVVLETPEGNLSKVMHYINGSYTNYFNRRMNRSGHLFQGRYKAILVDVDSYLLELSRYIHLNPVRAGIVEKPESYPYSSYKSFISKSGEGIVERDLIWGMISKNERYAASDYRAFVERGLNDGVENPLTGVYAGSILGKKSFIREAVEKLKEGTFSKEEVSHRKELNRRYQAEEILAIVSKHFGAEAEEILGGKGRRRDLFMHLVKRQTCMTNREIGNFVGGLSYSGVARAEERFAEKCRKNSVLRKEVEVLLKKMSNVKG